MNFYQQFDELLKSGDLEKCKEFLNHNIEMAIKESRSADLILLLNEAIGFYRDLSLFDDSILLARSLEKILSNQNLDNKDALASYINIANSYRAGGEFSNSLRVFDLAFELLDSNSHLKAAYYNNLGLLYLDMQEYSKAEKSYLKALEYVDKNDEVKLLTTYINLAYAYFGVDDLNNTQKYLNKLEKFENYKSDFHYPGYKLLKARVTSDLMEKKNNYELALAYLFKNVGRSKLYLEVSKEYQEVLKKLNLNYFTKGLDLAREYYEFVKDELFSLIPSKYHNYLTIGLFGLGSECYGLDDEISLDHDYDPNFIILVNDKLDKDAFEVIKDAYLKLPKVYKYFYISNLDKKGVHYYSKYLKDYLGYNENPSSLTKSLITNGEVFYEGLFNEFNNLRSEIKKSSINDFLKDLGLLSLKINQYIPYNLNRCKMRDDLLTYKLLKNHLVDHLIEYYYLINKMFLMHDKLSLKLINKDSQIYKWIRALLEDREVDENEILGYLVVNLAKYNIIKEIKTIYIEDYREEIIEFIKDLPARELLINEVVELEWQMFTILNSFNGKESCQNNKPYFTLMRKSQFYLYSEELLKSYHHDLLLAKEYNYNLLEIKYAFMEESIDREAFEKIKDRLPKLDARFIELRENIIQVQLEMVEKLKDGRSNDLEKMRNIYSVSDEVNNVSMETYLRGELSSLSEKTLFLYAQNLINYSKSNKNFVELVLNYSHLFYNGEKF